MDDEQLRNIYRLAKTIAVVGLSDNPDRPSYQVATYLKQHGYRIVPINPKYAVILGEPAYPDLVYGARAISPTQIDIVDIFRKAEDVPPHVEEALVIHAPVVWMQEGIEHHDAAQKAKGSNVKVVMNRCLMKEHRRLFPAPNSNP